MVKQRDERGHFAGTKLKALFGTLDELTQLLGKTTPYVERSHLTSRLFDNPQARKTFVFSRDDSTAKRSFQEFPHGDTKNTEIFMDFARRSMIVSRFCKFPMLRAPRSLRSVFFAVESNLIPLQVEAFVNSFSQRAFCYIMATARASPSSKASTFQADIRGFE